MQTHRAVIGGLFCALSLSACGSRGDFSLGKLVSATGEPSPSDGGASSSSQPPIPAATSSETDGDSLVSSSSASASGEPASTSTGVVDASDASPTCADAELPDPAVRYDFSGEGTLVADLMGGPSGELRGGASLQNTGNVTLDGEDDYVDLPNGLLSSHTSLTLVVWASLTDGPAYWRLLDFGNGSEGEDPAGAYVGTTYVAITTETGLEPSGLALLVGHGGASAEDRALTSLRLESPQVALAVVLDGEERTASLYVEGQLEAAAELTDPLSALEDVNNWLGRSQYAADPYYPGTYSELRVYSEALDDCRVRLLAQLGPDVLR